MSNRRPQLFTPGPVEVAPELVEAAGFIVHHRSLLFRHVMASVRRSLRPFFGTEGDIILLACSGSGAMEAAVSNFVSPGDRALVIRTGKYGSRWGELCKAYGAAGEWMDVQPGEAVRADEVRRRVEGWAPRAVLGVHVETSTGARNDIEAVARAVSGRATLIVDVISSLGVHEIRMDEWGIDVAVGASQKGLGLPPGLGFVALGGRALRRMADSRSPRYYFDLRKYVAAAGRDETPFTAPVGQIAALRCALDQAKSPGQSIRRYARAAAAVRAGVRALGLDLYPEVSSNAVTVFRVPEHMDATRLVHVLEAKHGIRIAHGQGELRGRILRLGHLGRFEDEDLVRLFEGLEAGLQECGVRVARGGGVRAVQSALAGFPGRSADGS